MSATRRNILLWGLGAVATAAAAARADITVFEIVLKNRKIESGARTLRARQNDTLVLRWRSDEAVTLHLHGYDVEIAVEPDRAATMTIEARATGRFAVEAHGFGDATGTKTSAGTRHVTLLYLEVHPR